MSAKSTDKAEKKLVLVVVRVRPQIHHEDNLWVDVVDQRTLQTLNHRNTDEVLQYDFANVFGPAVSQKEVYDTCVKQLLKDTLEGKNASVFAYGPTGAGKTHTILGPVEDPGIIPRAMADIFTLVEQRKSELVAENWDFQISFSYLEIYQEKVLDLLDTTQKDLPIREDGQKKIFVSGLREEKIHNIDEFITLFGPASKNRTTAVTRLNERSSRSHSILVLKVRRQQKIAPFRILTGKFHIIDLAGSEDNRRTGNKGIRLKESGSINSSLLALGQVVEALNRNAVCVPYRSSKLTRLLQDSLGGSANTCMIVNLSPEERYYFDTFTTLHFARKSKKIVNTVKVNESCEHQNRKRKISAESSKGDTSISKSDLESSLHSPPRPISLPIPAFSPFIRQQNSFNQKLLERVASLERVACQEGMGSTKEHLETMKEPLSKVKMEIMADQEKLKKVFSDRSSKENSSASANLSASPMFTHPPCIKKRKGPSVSKVKTSRDPNTEAQQAHNRKILDLLNVGSVKELQLLQTVGQKRAQLIFDWRTLNGPFEEITDLSNVVGISAKYMKGFLDKNMIQL